MENQVGRILSGFIKEITDGRIDILEDMEDDFFSDHGLTSLETVLFIISIENHFGYEVFENASMETLTTISRVVECINSKSN